jgi:PAS domain S-box-containing protein
VKVLIVDDDENSRIFLERTLRGRHYSTESASNGAAALEKAYQWRPDLIISDILMPGMNGFELCRRIKTDEQLRNVPFIFYTATFVDQKDEQLAMALGASRFLVKPMDPTDFFRVIEEVIQEYEQKTLSVPDQPLENMKVLCEMEEGSLARKLDKKVRALDREHKALIESEGRFRALTESTSDWIWEMDRNGVYTYSSPKVRDLLGYGVEEVIGKTPFDFMSPQERSHVAGLFRSIVRSKKPFQAFENTALHKDGSELVLEKSGVPFFDKRGGLEGYRGIDRDITERKRSEKALLVSEMKYRNLLEDIQLLAVMLDRDGNITFCNDYILALTGWTRADVMERNWFDLFIPEGERKNVRSVFTSGISDGTIVARYENSIVTREGTSKLIVWDNSVLRDHEGKAISGKRKNSSARHKRWRRSASSQAASRTTSTIFLPR